MAEDTAKKDAATILKEEEAMFDGVVKELSDKWEPKLCAMEIPANPNPTDIRGLVHKIDKLNNDVALELRKSKAVRDKIKEQIDYRKASLIEASVKDKATDKANEAKAKLNESGLLEALHLADAKYNYVCSIEERLKRKKEMLNIDRGVIPVDNPAQRRPGE